MTILGLGTIPTRHIIALFFTCVVLLIIAVFGELLFYFHKKDFEERTHAYVYKQIGALRSMDQAQKKIDHMQIYDSHNNVVFQRGVYKNKDFKIDGRRKIIHYGGKFYIHNMRKLRDGSTMCYAQDVTEIIYERNNMIKIFYLMSVLAVMFVYVIGYIFGWIILSPIRRINYVSENFSIHKSLKKQKIFIQGAQQDEIVLLSTTLNSLFARIIDETKKIEQFSADVTHEFKNKLFELSSTLQLAKKTGKHEQFYDRLLSQISSMTSLIESLMLLAKLDEKHIEKKIHNLSEVLKEVDGITHKRVEIHVDKNIYINIKKDLFLLGVYNIVSNALKYSSEEDNIFISTEIVSAGKYNLIIRDTGQGIAPENLKKIWDRFFKEDSSRAHSSGYGIGLSLTRKVIQDIHNFPICVKSELGKGTTFIIVLNTE